MFSFGKRPTAMYNFIYGVSAHLDINYYCRGIWHNHRVWHFHNYGPLTCFLVSSTGSSVFCRGYSLVWRYLEDVFFQKRDRLAINLYVWYHRDYCQLFGRFTSPLSQSALGRKITCGIFSLEHALYLAKT